MQNYNIYGDFMYYMFLADGFEETEALVTLDMMRRAGIDVGTVGIGSLKITGTHSITVLSDMLDADADIDNCEGIILPGGMPGADNLFASDYVNRFLDYCFAENKMIAAICAAPFIPGRLGMLQNKKAVCFPGFESELKGAEIVNSLCVVDDNIITAKGAGAVFEFSYEIMKYVCGCIVADSVIKTIQHKGL